MNLDLTPQDEKRLKGLLAALETKTVIGMVGAGLSVPVGYPTWQGLIELLVRHFEATNFLAPEHRLAVQAKKANPCQFAQLVRGRMSRDAYLEFLTETFAPRCSCDFSIEHEMAVRLPIKLWTTTNYDACLMDALREWLDITVLPTDHVPFDELETATKTVPKVVHLHGTIVRPETMVLTSQDYISHYYNTPRTRDSIQALASRTIFFIGYNFGDPDFTEFMKALRAHLGQASRSHYALLSRPPEADNLELQLKVMELEDAGIQPIFYPATSLDHSARVQLLRRMLQHFNTSIPAGGSAVHIAWDSNEDAADIPSKLRQLTNSARVKLHLISCDTGRRLVEIRTKSNADADTFRQAIESSSIWKLTNEAEACPVEPLRSILPSPPIKLQRRDGKPFDVTSGLPHLPLSNSKSAETKSQQVSRSTLPESGGSAIDVAQCHRTVLHALAAGVIDPTHLRAADLLKPLVPSPLDFGLHDCFHPILDWRPNSPIVTAWVFNQQNDSSPSTEGFPIAVTIVGDGLPEIRQQIEAAAYAALIQIGSGQTNIITHGFIHLSVLHVDDHSLKPSAISKILAMMGVGARSAGTEVTVGDTPKQAIAELVKLLRELQQTTGFVQIYSLNRSELMDRLSLLRKHCDHPPKEQPIVVAPQPARHVLIHFPYPLFNPKNPRMVVQLPSNLLKSPELLTLMEAYYGSILTQLTAALERRIEFYAEELRSNRREVEWFKNLPEESQSKVKDIYANQKVDYELATTFVVEGTVVPASKYYLEHLPHNIIPEKEKELERLEAMRQPLKELRGKWDSPLWDHCLSRCFDCAVREVTFCDNTSINALYEAWRSLVVGTLRLELDGSLSSNGVPTGDVFKRTTIFHTVYRPFQQILEITAYALIDSSRSTVVIDPRRNTVQVLDPVDDALFESRPIESVSNDTDTILSQLASGEEEKVSLQRIRSVAFQSPNLAERVSRAILDQKLPTSAITSLRKKVRERAMALSTGARYIRMANHFMRNTADGLIEPLWRETDLLPNQALCLFILECFKQDIKDPYEVFRCLHANLPVRTTPRILSLFKSAITDGGAIGKYYLLTKCVGKEDPHFSPAESVAAKIEHIMEAIDMFSEFIQSCRTISVTGESLSSILVKTATAFELTHQSIWVEPTPTVDQIQRKLTGEPLPN